MKPETQDSLAYTALDLAFSGKRQAMNPRQHRQIQSVARQAKYENKESGLKRRLRYLGLGPSWGRFA